jgi:hypothetical protein
MVAETLAILDVGEDHHSQLQFTGEHRRFDLAPADVVQVEIDVRVVGAKTGEQRRQEVAEHGIGGGNADRAVQIVDAKARFAQSVLQRVEDVPRVLIEAVPLGSERDAVRLAIEQSDPQPVFKKENGVGDRRLRDEQARGRHRELTALGSCREIA